MSIRPATGGLNTHLDKVEYNPLLKIYDSGIDSKLQELKTHTDTLSRAMQDSLTETEKRLKAEIQELSEIEQISAALESQTESLTTVLESQTESLTTVLESQTESLTTALKSQTDSLATVLESQTGSLVTVLESQTDTIDAIKDELDKAKKAQNSVRLLIGSEESLKNKDFLKKKWHRLSDRLSDRFFEKRSDIDSLVTIVPIGEPLYLKKLDRKKLKLVGGPGLLVLKALVYHSGKLKEHQYKWETDRDTTITFTDPLLGGMHILAVVERRNN